MGFGAMVVETGVSFGSRRIFEVNANMLAVLTDENIYL